MYIAGVRVAKTTDNAGQRGGRVDICCIVRGGRAHAIGEKWQVLQG